jgi:hypothetical protein
MQVPIELLNWQLALLVGLPTLVSLAGLLTNNYRLADTNAQMVQLRNQIHSDNQVLTGMIIGLKERVSKLETSR